MTSKTKNRLIEFFLYAITALCALFALWQLRGARLLPQPYSNMDQFVISRTAIWVANGHLPDFTLCRYSPIYVIFLSLPAFLASGKLVAMRTMQTLLLSLTPAVIFRAGRELKLGKKSALLGALCFLFSPTTVLLSLDFLRAGFLALLVSFFLLFTARMVRTHSLGCAWMVGLLSGCLILGRENFFFLLAIPPLLFCLPLCRVAMKKIPGNVWLRIGLGAAASILPVCFYNLFVSGQFSVIPGNAKSVLTFFYGSGSLANAAPEIVSRFPGRVYDMICNYEIPNSLSIYAHRAVVPFLKIFCIPFNLLLIFAAAALCCNFKKELIFLALLCAGYFGSLSFVDIFYRFRLPILPVIALGAGVFLSGCKEMFRKTPRKAALYALLMTAAFLLTYQIPEKRILESEWIATVNHLLWMNRLDDAENSLKLARKYGKPLMNQEMCLLMRLMQTDSERAKDLANEWQYQIREVPRQR